MCHTCKNPEFAHTKVQIPNTNPTSVLNFRLNESSITHYFSVLHTPTHCHFPLLVE